MAIVERGAETAAALAGSKAMEQAKRGNFKKALLWSMPLAAAVLLLLRYRSKY